ncbi:aldose 1-epimerase [Sphingosinicella sp. BN140058]|uniref:aldose 1-epimerase n=1 Tax=Sphingosinicella sp. BN140058 TaxID=1892855 RepID=UPI0010109F98|nr:aldose 1-epimerase [Sphingosinicella sp. BN140058]QAY78259.1 aldose 1-epimerase [Sphingosinicella sp. BN140058]
MTDDSRPILSSDTLTLVLAPAWGGSIARFDYRSPEKGDIPVFRGLDADQKSILDSASFPLVPFVNRIRDGRFSFRGREVSLSLNLPGEASPLHGQGWTSPWQVVRLEDRSAELVFEHSPGEWPWAYEARQIFTLDDGGLTMVLRCTNRSDAPMPCGLGHHPYFPCTTETRLDTEVESVWTIDDKVLPVEKVWAEGRYDLKDRPVCGQDLDHGFGGWGGTARISDPARPLRIEVRSDDAKFFQLYSPAEGGIFVAEPVTHANAALNEPEGLWPELGIKVLDPGESMSLTMRVDVIPV